MTWKYLLKNIGSESTGNYIKNKNEFSNSIKLILSLQETEMKYDENDLKTYIDANSFFNRYDNASQQFIRSYFIFIKSPFNKGSKQETSLESVQNSFLLKFNISLEKYIYLTSALVFRVLNIYNDTGLIRDNWFINPNTLLPASDKSKEYFANILKEMSFDIYEANKWILQEDEINNETHVNFSFDLFLKKPFLKISHNEFIPIERKILEDLLFHSLYIKTMDSFSKEDKKRIQYRSDFGLMLETYVCWLTLVP
ncbi:hypothetical protein PaeBR_17050 [Paenibacillus sp. BR2-3]|uniref:hypothetical protein n=1 Tax=Paenibacillus sp. BR2-3 TaxID=3048494 RepID=UPI0039778D88